MFAQSRGKVKSSPVFSDINSVDYIIREDTTENSRPTPAADRCNTKIVDGGFASHTALVPQIPSRTGKIVPANFMVPHVW